MILYFSATGNCKYVATRLAQSEKQEMLSIVDCLKNDQYSFSDKTIGIISPTYYWGLPSIVKEFLEKASFQTEYLYYIATYGTMPGASGAIANKAIQKRKIDAYYSVRMVDTWTPILTFPPKKKLPSTLKIPRMKSVAFSAASKNAIRTVIWRIELWLLLLNG